MRIGKTYLVEETFAGRFTFNHTALSPLEYKDGESLVADQLRHFHASLMVHGSKEDKCPTNWLDAFYMLERLLQEKDDGSRQLVFIDELPWMDTPKSKFVTALEAFWNGWASKLHNFMLVVCGSSNSWMLNRLINNHGGLYGRLTYEIKLSPFTLAESEQFLHSRDVELSRYDIAHSCMIFGGVPYYLGYLEREKSLAQSVDSLFFSRDAKLRFEFQRLFSSVFDNPQRAETVVRMLNGRSAGYTYREIVEKTGISDGGGLSALLNSLVASDFVLKYVPFGFSKRQVHYKLVDPFCLFYLRFVDGAARLEEDFWEQNVSSQSIAIWRGLAFENLCFLHVPQIKKVLGISGVITQQSAWTKRVSAGLKGQTTVGIKGQLDGQSERAEVGE